MTTRSVAALLALTLPWIVAAPAFAQGTAAQQAACSGDAFRLCASAIPNADKVAACLRRERERLSPACRSVFDTAEGDGRSGVAATAKPSPDTAAPSEPKTETKADPAPGPETPRIVAAQPTPQPVPKQPRVAARVAPRPAALPRAVAKRAPTARERVKQADRTPSSVRPALKRQAANSASHRHRGRRGDTDLAQARYWMKRVTGISIGNLAGLLAN